MSTATTTRRYATHDSGRAHARAGGIFYLLTFATSIPAALMLGPILNDPGYILSVGADSSQILWACLLTSRTRWRVSAARSPCFR